jgi:DNA-binding FadR family transcriptional regulator
MTKPRLRIPGTIAQDLGNKIVSGRFKPGAVLEGEVAASGQRNVSRSAYREAVRILVAKGLVESKPKLGTRVSAMSRWHLLDPDVISWIFSAQPNNDQLSALFEMRGIVEPEVAALAAKRRTKEQLAEMTAALADMKHYKLHTPKGRLADRKFHAALLAASGNPFLMSLNSSMDAAVAWTTVFKYRNHSLERDSMPDHVKVHEAVAAGNVTAARRAMHELVELAFQDTLRAWAQARGKTAAKKPAGKKAAKRK